MSIFGWYDANGEAVVNYLDKPQTSPTIPGGSVLKIGSNKNEYCMDVYVEVTDLTKDEVMWVAGTYRQAVTSVAAVDVECDDAVYYNLQGVRVENPEKGIFVKVLNGKASKVVK